MRFNLHNVSCACLYFGGLLLTVFLSSILACNNIFAIWHPYHALMNLYESANHLLQNYIQVIIWNRYLKLNIIFWNKQNHHNVEYYVCSQVDMYAVIVVWYPLLYLIKQEIIITWYNIYSKIYIICCTFLCHFTCLIVIRVSIYSFIQIKHHLDRDMNECILVSVFIHIACLSCNIFSQTRYFSFVHIRP